MINTKSYIGITKLTINERFNKHKRDSLMPLYPLHIAMQKYGIENFKIELLEESEDRNFISGKEQPTIELHETHISKNGYNVAVGGYGGDLGPAANLKRRNTILNYTAEKKEDISEKLSKSHTGLRRTVDEKENMSRLQKERGGYGPTNHTNETCLKISKGNIGKTRTEKARQNYSKSAKLRGTGPHLQGKRISCICCKKSWDLGNYSQHINRK